MFRKIAIGNVLGREVAKGKAQSLASGSGSGNGESGGGRNHPPFPSAQIEITRRGLLKFSNSHLLHEEEKSTSKKLYNYTTLFLVYRTCLQLVCLPPIHTPNHHPTRCTHINSWKPDCPPDLHRRVPL